MNLSAPFIHRPVATSLLTLAVLLAGGLAFSLLPVAPLPQVEYPVIFVNAGLPGASPETMASAVATPLERQFGRIAGINQMTSTSQLGQTNVVMVFDLNRDIDAAARDVQASINAAQGELPANLPTNPGWRKVNPADAPIMTLSLTSATVPKPKMYDLGDSVLAQELSQVQGVGQVSVAGGARPAVRVEANPTALSNYGLSLEDLRNTLGNANANRPKGELTDKDTRWTIQNTDQLFLTNEYASLIIAYKNGNAVRVRDVASVVDAVEDIRNAGISDGRNAVLIQVFKQPGANIIEAADAVRAMLPFLQASIPPTVKLTVENDRTVTIRASVKDVERTLVVSIVLVILVVFIFLRSVHTTIIPSVSVPLSLMGTFAIMYLLGYSIDNLSLMALTISTGFVVDDAIVVIENIMRHLEGGMSPYPAALQGSSEIGFTVLSMSTSLIAVFLPILLMGGIVGRLFREFAVTLSIAIAMSLVVSLTVTPMMCARFLESPHGQKHGWLYMKTERGFQAILAAYRVTLQKVLRHQPLVLGITILAICVNIYLYIIVPKGFFPQQDTGRIGANLQANQDISFTALNQKLQQFSNILRTDPAVDHVTLFTGRANSVNGMVILKPFNERKISSDEVIARLRPKLARIAGANAFLVSQQELQIGGRMSNAQYQYTLQTESLQDLNYWAPRLVDRLKTVPILRDVSMDQLNRGLEARMVIDRDTASRLGVSANDIDQTLYDAFGQRQVSTVYKSLNQYHVVMEIDPSFQGGPDSLKNIYVKSSTGMMVPLSAVSHYEPSNTALQVNHQGQFPAITVTFSLPPGVSLSVATAAIEKGARDIGMPSTVRGSFQGTAAAFQDSLASMPWLILAALATVYIVLGILYESYIHPITILSTLPSAGVGALLALLLFKVDLSIIAMIGILLLIGIVKKNAIMMVDFAIETERKNGKTPEEAIFEACLLRFRPIMMTTCSALLGAMPLAFGYGTGGELRKPLGISIVGGLLVSQALTLFTTPVVYLYMDRFQLRLKQRKEARRAGRAKRLGPPGAEQPA